MLEALVGEGVVAGPRTAAAPGASEPRCGSEATSGCGEVRPPTHLFLVTRRVSTFAVVGGIR